MSLLSTIDYINRQKVRKRYVPEELEDDNGRPDSIGPFTDLANALRFAKDHSGRLRYVRDRQIWMRFNGHRWEPAERTHLQAMAKRTVRGMLGEAEKMTDGDPSTIKELLKWAVKSMSARAMAAMIDLAASEPEFAAHSSEFDTSPYLLTTDSGTVELDTGVHRDHDPDDRITKVTAIEYADDLGCPRWLQFLDEVFAGDQALIGFIQRAIGYTLTGETREHAFFVLWGNGKNGKGRFIRQLMALLGDAAKTTSFSTFTVGRFNQAEANTPALAALAGARLVVAGEPDEGVRLSESVIKALTGEDEIQACAKYERPFEYVPRFKIWLHTNHKPEIRGVDTGIWRRPRLIPFTVSFEGREDLQLDEKLDAERPGILAWAVRGAADWYEHGLGTCAAVTDATSAYRKESDPLAPFVEDCLNLDPKGFAQSSKVYQAYELWCGRNGIEALKGHVLTKKLVARGLVPGKEADRRGLRGCTLKADASLPTKPSEPSSRLKASA